MKNYSLILSAAVIAALLIDPVITGTIMKALQYQSFNMPRIFGGRKAKADEYPWMISIQYKAPPNQWNGSEARMQHDCGGAIIDSKYIVTAGHCVWNRTVSEIEVIAGALNIKKTETSQQRRKLDRIYLHPNYTSGDSPGPYDIAVLQIKTAFNFNQHVKKIDLANCKESAMGRECHFAGWGNTFPLSTLHYRGSDVLLVERANIINMKECKEVYSSFKTELSTAICSMSGVLHGTCQGDSGGPLVCYRGKHSDPYLAGVVSFGFPVCNDGYHPDVYTNLGDSKICDYFSEIGSSDNRMA